MNVLRKSGWHDEYENLIYFQIFENDRCIWSSTMWDIREIFDSDLKSEKEEWIQTIIDRCNCYCVQDRSALKEFLNDTQCD